MSTQRNIDNENKFFQIPSSIMNWVESNGRLYKGKWVQLDYLPFSPSVLFLGSGNSRNNIKLDKTPLILGDIYTLEIT